MSGPCANGGPSAEHDVPRELGKASMLPPPLSGSAPGKGPCERALGTGLSPGSTRPLSGGRPQNPRPEGSPKPGREGPDRRRPRGPVCLKPGLPGDLPSAANVGAESAVLSAHAPCQALSGDPL